MSNVNVKITEDKLVELKSMPGVIRGLKKRQEDQFNFFKPFCNVKHRILDVGCREGLWIDRLKEFGYSDIVGIDISGEAIEFLKERGHNGYACNAEDMSIFEDNSFDVVTGTHVLEHCPNPDRVISESHRILKTNGLIFMEVPFQKKERVPTRWGHYYCFVDKEEFLSFFKDFELLKIKLGPKNNWVRGVFKKI